MNHEYNYFMNIAILEKQTFDLFQYTLTGRQLDQLKQYAALLKAWNQKFNLTAISDEEGIQQKHFLDSISTVVALKNRKIEKVIDVGTGAGFPGLGDKNPFSRDLFNTCGIGRKKSTVLFCCCGGIGSISCEFDQ